jgi:hypothetical protein
MLFVIKISYHCYQSFSFLACFLYFEKKKINKMRPVRSPCCLDVPPTTNIARQQLCKHVPAAVNTTIEELLGMVFSLLSMSHTILDM